MTVKKKYIIHCDLEGITGIVRGEQVDPASPLYENGQKLFMEDFMFLIEGLREGGATEIYAYDQHYFGTNIDMMRIPSYVRVICGKPLYAYNWVGETETPFVGAILLGLHAKSGNADSLLSHSYEYDIKDIRINGFSVGEIGLEAAIAGDFNVPLVLITGDSDGVAEAKKIVKNIKSVIVKESIGYNSAVCYPVAYTSRMIRDAAKDIVTHPPDVPLFKFDGPIDLEVELHNTPFLTTMHNFFSEFFKEKKDTFKIHGANVADTWKEYLKRKLYCLVQDKE